MSPNTPQAETSGDEGFQEVEKMESEVSTEVEMKAETEAQAAATAAIESADEEATPPVPPATTAPPGSKAPTVPTTQEEAPHGFKTRFRPTFDPNVGIFKVTKRLPCESGVYLVGDFVYPDQENIDSRRLRLLFSQRYVDYPTNDEIEKLWNDPKAKEVSKKKAAQNRLDEIAAEAKYEADRKAKAAEQAKKDRQTRAGNVNPVHDHRG